MSQFQLFPPPSAEVKAAKNPFRRGIKKPATVKVEPTSPISLHETKDSAKAESVLLQIIEDTSSFPPPPSHPPNPRAKSPSVVKSSPSSNSPQSPRSRSRQENKYTSRASPSQGSLSTSSSSSHTASSTTSPQSSQSSVSPVPMRSMFPRFDPKLPLHNQISNPQRPNGDLPSKKSQRPQLTLTTSSEIDHVLGPKTVPASVLNFPNGISDSSEEIRYSTPYELEMLWEAANGQRPQNLSGTFNLHMTRYVSHWAEIPLSFANLNLELDRQPSHSVIPNSHSTLYRPTRMTNSQSRGELHPNPTAMYLL